MVLTPQTLAVTFRGLQQSSPRQLSAPGSLTRAENLVVKRGNEGGFEFTKRNGLTSIVTTPDATGARLVEYGDALLVKTRGTLHQLRAAQAQLANMTGTVPATATGLIMPQTYLGQKPIVSPTGNLSEMSSAGSSLEMGMTSGGTYSIYAWIETGTSDLIYIVNDNVAASVRSCAFITTGTVTNVKVVALNDVFYVFFKKANDLRCFKIDPETLAFTGPSTVVAAGSLLAGTDYDVQSGWNSTQIAAIYRTSAGSYRRAFIDSSFAVAGAVDDATAANQPDVGLCWLSQENFSGGSLYYATINAANGTRLQQVSQAALASQGATTGTLATGVTFAGYVSSGTPRLLAEQSDTFDYNHRIADKDGNVFGFRSLGLASRVFWSNSRPTFAALYNSEPTALQSQDTYFLCDALNLTIVGKALGGLGGRREDAHVSSAPVDSSGVAHFAAKKVVEIDSGAGVFIKSYGIVDISATAGDARIGAPLLFAGTVYFPGPRTMQYDGAAAAIGQELQFLHEAGFDVYPEKPVTTPHSGTGGSIGAGTRSYRAVYVWNDNTGQVDHSAPSEAVTVVLAAGGSSCDVAVANLRTGFRSARAVELYRTIDGGTEYLKIAELASLVGDTWTFVDTLADSAIDDNEPLYTDSGELENVAPPAFSVMCEHGNRAFGVSMEEPHVAWYSKEHQSGTVPGWGEGFKIETPTGTGPIYAMFSMDGHLVLLKKDTAYVVSGDFLDAAGTGTKPRALGIPALAGTTEPCSVLRTQFGTIFHSIGSGFWLVDRSLQMARIGANVQDDAQVAAITSAVLFQSESQARFTSSGGTTFVLDLDFAAAGQYCWTTWTGQAAAHACLYKGTWTILSPAGSVRQENAGWADDGAAFTSRLTVADINFNGVNGYVQAWAGRLIGEWKSAHTIQIVETPDGRADIAETFDFVATTNPNPYELEMKFAWPEVRSIALDITDVGNTGEGFAWTALTFEIGLLPGLRRNTLTSTMD